MLHLSRSTIDRRSLLWLYEIRTKKIKLSAHTYSVIYRLAKYPRQTPGRSNARQRYYRQLGNFSSQCHKKNEKTLFSRDTTRTVRTATSASSATCIKHPPFFSN